jgi:hypothetical protein
MDTVSSPCRCLILIRAKAGSFHRDRHQLLMNQHIPGNIRRADHFAPKWLRVLPCLLAVACIYSCSNSNSVTQPILAGSISGHAYLIDSTGSSETTSNNVTVWLAELPISTPTDSAGGWTLNNVPIGTYEVLATKQGYGTMKWFDEQVTGPGTLYIDPVYIYPAPDCTLFLDSVTTSAGNVNFFGRIEGPSDAAYIQFDVDSDSTTEPGDSHLIQSGVNGGYSIPAQGPWHFQAYQSSFGALPSGTRVFLSVYAYVYNANYDMIYDPSTGQTLPISPSKKSNSLPFIIP